MDARAPDSRCCFWTRLRPRAVQGADRALLAERAQVIYLDQRGAGRSDPGRPEDHRVERWADDVHGFCTALRIERPIVLGLGFGGIVALDYAARYPDHPGALVLIAPVARMVPERSIEVYERLGGAEAAEVASRFYGDLDGRGFVDFVRVCSHSSRPTT